MQTRTLNGNLHVAVSDLELCRRINPSTQGRRMATMTPPRNLPGLHDYHILQLLGEGGMGKVYVARHKYSGENVVVKTIHEHLLGEAKTRQRFQQEADL